MTEYIETPVDETQIDVVDAPKAEKPAPEWQVTITSRDPAFEPIVIQIKARSSKEALRTVQAALANFSISVEAA